MSQFSGVVLKNQSENVLIDKIKNIVKTDKRDQFQSGSVFLQKELLTERELEVLNLICLEYTTSGISEKLFISENTVESHRKKLFTKFGVRNMAGLVKRAIQLNLVN